MSLPSPWRGTRPGMPAGPDVQLDTGHSALKKYFIHLFILIGGWLQYCSGLPYIQYRSTIGIHGFRPSSNSLLTPSPPYLSRLAQSIDLNSAPLLTQGFKTPYMSSLLTLIPLTPDFCSQRATSEAFFKALSVLLSPCRRV